MKKLILILGIALCLVLSAAAFRFNQITAPVAYSTSTSTSVNISGGINITAFPFLAIKNMSESNFSTHVINVTILNKSSSSGAYGILASSLSLTVNATNLTGDTNNFWNFTATLKEGRNWLRLNFTNVSRNDDGSFGGSLTDEVIIDIDTKKYLLVLGGKANLPNINFSLDSGNVNISGVIKSKEIRLQNSSTTSDDCDASSSGTMRFNGSGAGGAAKFIQCDGTDWKTT